MASVLPLAAFVAVFLLFQKTRPNASCRDSFVSASVVWGLFVTAITEFLSIDRGLSYSTVAASWAAILIGATITLIVAGNWRMDASELRSLLRGTPGFERSLLVAVAAIAALVGVIAWISPPNNWDSMTYHMSRVVHWIQNRSDANYPTHILRQLHQNPWAEFAILNFQILSGSDRFANFIQWFCFAGAGAGVSLLAKQLGADYRGQVFAAVVAATIPMGILQASSTQNDQVVAFWLVCFTYYAIRLKTDGTAVAALATGASLGLAILTKGTAYLYAFPFMLWVTVSLVRSRRAKGAQLIALVITICLALNVGHYARNYTLYGKPLGPGQEGGSFRYANDSFNVSSTASNLVRNFGLHIGTPFDRINAVQEKGIYELHKLVGLDPNDPRTSWRSVFHIVPPTTHEDLAGNPIHLALILLCVPILFMDRRNKRDSRYYSLCVLGGFVFFAVYLKWQPWHSRLQLPLFVLWSPIIGLVLSQIRTRRVANAVIVVTILGALPWVARNSSRPLVGARSIIYSGRVQQYFTNRQSLYEPYNRSAQFLSKSPCADIGLMMGGDDWEYPFWALLRDNGKRNFRLEHSNVANISRVEYRKSSFRNFSPCALIVVNGDQSNEVRVQGVSYVRQSLDGPVGVFMRK